MENVNPTSEKITVEIIVNAPLETVWTSWNEPKHIMQWAFASDDWECPNAENDLKIGGQFKTVMAAKDKSFSFELIGTYTDVKNLELIEYTLVGGRTVSIIFTKLPEGIKVTETFDSEPTHSIEQQRFGWQSILGNFKKHTEKN